MKFKKLASVAVTALIGATIFTGCNVRDSKVVSHNLSYDADNFQLKRRIVFFNGITGKYVMEIIGYCSIHKDNTDNQLEVTCKIGQDKYKKHYFGLSDNTAYFIEQINSKTESKFNYKVVFKPQSILPDVTMEVNTKTIAPLPKLQTNDNSVTISK